MKQLISEYMIIRFLVRNPIHTDKFYEVRLNLNNMKKIS